MMKNTFKLWPILAMLACLISPQAQAITTGTYLLHSHPDGGIAPPLYGLRLDGLLGDASEEFTFDFDHIDSAMTLTWDGSKIVIDGYSFGGEVSGNAYVAGTTDVWDIHFEYTVGITQPGTDNGLDDLFVGADNMNFGTISSSTFGTYELENEGASQTFQFGDEGGAGHRGYDGISGWGWLNHGDDCITEDCTHIYASDWLFTAELVVVPVPAAIWLFGSGLLGLVAVARRRNV